MFAKALPMSMDFGGEFLARPSREWFRSDLETPEGKCPSEHVTLVSRVTSSEGRWMEKGFGRPERTSTWIHASESSDVARGWIRLRRILPRADKCPQVASRLPVDVRHQSSVR